MTQEAQQGRGKLVRRPVLRRTHHDVTAHAVEA